jgi:hypothetical protein
VFGMTPWTNLLNLRGAAGDVAKIRIPEGC